MAKPVEVITPNTAYTILAKDAVVGEVYLTTVMRYKIKVLRKEGNQIIVSSELHPGKEIKIFAHTELLLVTPDQVDPKPAVIPEDSKEEEIIDSEDTLNTSIQTIGEPTMAQNKNPRSVIIDTELLKYKKGDEVPWNKISDKVISAGKGTEKDAKNIINQARVRFKWYTEQGKTNPQSPEGKKAAEKPAKKAAAKKADTKKADTKKAAKPAKKADAKKATEKPAKKADTSEPA
jgi:hypothetical protein